MKTVLLICCFALMASVLKAQRVYFIYLQTESGATFFVRMNDKLYSSTSSGYLILSKLVDSTYNFKLGFPGKNIDFDFTTTLNKRDHGYLIKDLGEKGWGLFDLQTFSLQMSSGGVNGSARNQADSSVRVNAFTDLLARATDDPSLKQNAVYYTTVETEKKTEVVQAVQKEINKPVVNEPVVSEKDQKKADESASTAKDNGQKKPDAGESIVKDKDQKKPDPGESIVRNKEPKKQEVSDSVVTDKDHKKPDVSLQKVDTPVIVRKVNADTTAALTVHSIDSISTTALAGEQATYKRSKVRKISGVTTAAGTESVFTDALDGGQIDTIRILIASQNSMAEVKDNPSDSAKTDRKFLDIDPDSTKVAKHEQAGSANEGLKKGGIFSKDRNESETNRDSSSGKTGLKKLFSFTNKAGTDPSKKCQVVAGQEDFLKLRRKMAAKTNDDGMLEEARKYFKVKCFTTEQVKNLSSMFLSSAGKFNFFDLASNYVSDRDQFPSLQLQLTDAFYLNQFKTRFAN